MRGAVVASGGVYARTIAIKPVTRKGSWSQDDAEGFLPPLHRGEEADPLGSLGVAFRRPLVAR